MTRFRNFPSTPGLVCAIALTLALGGTGIPVAAATYDLSIEDRSCDIVTAQMIATALDVPADSLEQSHYVASQCDYEMERDNEDIVNVEVALDVYETDERAADYFRQSTQSMSPEDISKAMKAVRAEAKSGNDGAQEKVAAGIVSGLMQQGNLLIRLRASHGLDMPIPEKTTSDSIIKAVSDWQNDTLTEHRQQTLALAKLVLAGL